MEKNVKYLLKSYYRAKVTYSNFRFYKFKKFISRSVFGELQLTQISLNFQNFLLQLKNQRSGSRVWLFYYFYFETNYDVLKSKSLHFLLNENINVNKNETESKMENPTHNFRKRNLIYELRIKSNSPVEILANLNKN